MPPSSKRLRGTPTPRRIASLIALGAALAAPSGAWACAPGDGAYVDAFPDASCLLLGDGTQIDADGGLRLKTGGTSTTTTWDTPADFNNLPTGDVGSLRVVGTGATATLELPTSGLPLTRATPGGSVTGAELRAGPTQIRDSDGVDDPSVIRQGSTYVMYYTGHAEDGAPSAIYRVTSPDGRSWARPAPNGQQPSPEAVLSAGPVGAFDDGGVSGAEVIYDPSDSEAPYRMYYTGTSRSTEVIGYATSTDGIAWTKHNQPVLRPGLPGARDGSGVSNPSVLKDGSIYKMWYEADDSTVRAIGYATSVDGLTWKRAGLPAALQQDPLGGGDPKVRFGVYSPTVWRTSTGYRMVFVGRNASDPTSTRLLGATSSDGIDWTLGGPELNPHAARFYASNFASPDVLEDAADGAAPVKLYFAGDRANSTPSDDRARIGLAEAASATGALSVFTGGNDPLEAVYNPGADSARFDARNVSGLSVADPGGANDWVGAYAGTRSREAGATRPRLGIATIDPTAATPEWTKRDGSLSDGSILPLGAAGEDANGQRDPSLAYKAAAGATDDWWMYYTALPSDGSAPSIRLASSDEDNAANQLRPTTWTKAGLVVAGASHPSVLREGPNAPTWIYHTVEDGSPNSMAVVESTFNDDLDGPFNPAAAITLTGNSTCDPDGAKDPVVIRIGTTLHMLYTGLDGTAQHTCYATADATISHTAFTRAGSVFPPSEISGAYDESSVVPTAAFVDGETAGAPLLVFFTGTDRGELRFVDAVGTTAHVDRRTRIGRATSAIPITKGLMPSGTATGQVGVAGGPLVDFRSISRAKSGAKVVIEMSVLQPYSTQTSQFWSDWFPVLANDVDTAAQDLTFRFGVRAARWRARLTEPTGTPKLDTVTVASGPLQFVNAGTATTTEITPPDGFSLGSWGSLLVRSETFTVPGATASPASGTVTVLGADNSTIVQATPLALNGGAEQTISLAGIPAAANPKLKVRFDLAATGPAPQSTPLVKQLQATYIAAPADAGGPPAVVDGDNDGVADAVDQCPTAAGPAATGGCPDADGDGLADAKDQCPSAAGPASLGGCPDGDGDGVVDGADACPAVAAPGSPNGCPVTQTLQASTRRVIYGSSALLSGVVARGPSPVPGQQLTILARPVGTAAPSPVASVVTDIAGRWSLVVRPKRATTYTVSLAGVPAPAPVSVGVAHKLSLRLRVAGRRITFVGTLSPKHTKRLVRLERKSGTRWGLVKRLRTGSRSTVRLIKAFSKGRYQFRLRTAADTQHLAGRSAVKRITLK